MFEIPKLLFKHDAVEVAQFLLGKIIKYKNCSGMIVETEAYKSDEASHAFTRTERSEIMFSSYGKWYIYFVYGMYNCINITTNKENEPGAVLIRALEPIEGINEMKKRRSEGRKNKKIDIHNLCSGPGKLCDALGINKSLNGTDINDKIKLFSYKSFIKEEILKSKRVGLRKAVDLDWRFYVKDSKFVSKPL